MLGVPEDDGSEQVLQPTRRSPPKRRRQPPAPSRARPRLDQPFAARNVRGGHRALIAIAVAAVIAAGGWLAFQSIGPDGFRPMIDRLTALVSLPGSTRTAEDSSFGDREDGVSPEQAVSNLETRARQETGGADGPPIPKFKPLPGATRSLSAGSDDPAQLAANGGEDDSGEPSIFEQLWRYLSPG